MNTFDKIFARLLGHEGGYVNNPDDPGGETNWGISKRSYPDEDIKNLTRDQAMAIYRRDFWDRIKADEFDPAIAFQVFDFAVNSGVDAAIRKLQRAVGVADDGHWGPISRAAMSEMSVPDVVMRLNGERLDYMTQLSGWQTFGRGWARRIAGNLRYGVEDT